MTRTPAHRYAGSIDTLQVNWLERTTNVRIVCWLVVLAFVIALKAALS